VGTQPTGTAVWLSEAGTLVYRAGGVSAPIARLDLVDTAGRVAGRVPGEFAVTENPRFSPTGDRILVGIGSEQGGGGALQVFMSDLFVIDVRTGVQTRVTSGNDAAAASWSSDGTRAVYTQSIGDSFELWHVPVAGGAAPSRLVKLASIPVSSALVPDRRSVVVHLRSYRGSGPSGLFRVWLDGNARMDTLVEFTGEGVRPDAPRVSPDGKWLAFTDRNTSDVWVRALDGDAMMQVSATSTEDNPVVWGRDSRHLYYATTAGLVAIELQTSTTLGVVDRRVIAGFPKNHNYDISPDGKTFVVVTPVRVANDVFVAVNWADEARRAWRKD
jgi:Tol biopolymer transport system component